MTGKRRGRDLSDCSSSLLTIMNETFGITIICRVIVSNFLFSAMHDRKFERKHFSI